MNQLSPAFMPIVQKHGPVIKGAPNNQQTTLVNLNNVSKMTFDEKGSSVKIDYVDGKDETFKLGTKEAMNKIMDELYPKVDKSIDCKA